MKQLAVGRDLVNVTLVFINFSSLPDGGVLGVRWRRVPGEKLYQVLRPTLLPHPNATQVFRQEFVKYARIQTKISYSL